MSRPLPGPDPWGDQAVVNQTERWFRRGQLTIGGASLYPALKLLAGQVMPATAPSLLCWLPATILAGSLLIWGTRGLREISH